MKIEHGKYYLGDCGNVFLVSKFGVYWYCDATHEPSIAPAAITYETIDGVIDVATYRMVAR